jgi:flavin reductase (DIM6/NTAB) family NADH-FMN oxidoreductase RutF
MSRNTFRAYFQPSRVALAVCPDPALDRPNIITLCFTMHCSYKPKMIAFAVHRRSYTSLLLENARDIVLAIPGERLAAAAMHCGTTSGRTTDKAKHLGLTWLASTHIATPGIAECIANVELELVQQVITGDHVSVFGNVRTYRVDTSKNERCLLSIGPQHEGYELLERRGMHRLGAVRAAGNGGGMEHRTTGREANPLFAVAGPLQT